MKAALVLEIEELASIAKPTRAQLDLLLSRWSEYFDRMQIDTRDQAAEFYAIMRARVQAGSVSLTAPGLDDL